MNGSDSPGARGLVRRARASIAFRTRTAIRRATDRPRGALRRARAMAPARRNAARSRVVDLTFRVRRLSHYPADRAAAPTRPSAVVVEPDLRPRGLAARGFRPLYTLGRRRYASCSGVVWTRPDRLVVAHLLACTLVSYGFDDRGGTPRLDRRTTATGTDLLGQVTNLAVSPDGAWLAVTDSSFGRCTVYPIDPDTGDPVPDPAARVVFDGDRNLHGVEFSPDGRFLLYVGIDATAGIRRVSFVADATSRTCSLGTPERIAMTPGVAPKGLSFSPDGRFLAVGYGENASVGVQHDPVNAIVEVRPYDAATGDIGEVVGRAPASCGFATVEDVTWLPDGARLVVSDQAGDELVFCEVDPDSGAVGPVEDRIRWAAGGLRLPHGCATSPDGRWLAVANYGDSSLRFFAVGA